MTSTVDHLGPEGGRQHHSRRVLYGATTLLLTVIIGLAVADGVGSVDVYGVDTSIVGASGGGYDLEVRYGAVTRPALATPFDIVVSRPGGFDGPVTLAVERHYLAMWDSNTVLPAPSGETVDGEWVHWEFDPPVGDVLTVLFDARIEPAVQSGRSGAVAVVEDDVAVVTVEFHTRVLP